MTSARVERQSETAPTGLDEVREAVGASGQDRRFRHRDNDRLRMPLMGGGLPLRPTLSGEEPRKHPARGAADHARGGLHRHRQAAAVVAVDPDDMQAPQAHEKVTTVAVATPGAAAQRTLRHVEVLEFR